MPRFRALVALLPVPIVRSYGTIGVKLHKYTNFGGGLQLKECFNGTSMEPTWCLCKTVSFESPPHGESRCRDSWHIKLKYLCWNHGLIQKQAFFLRTLISISTFKYQFSSTNPHFEVAPVPPALGGSSAGNDGFIGFDAAVRHAGGMATVIME